jgi:hypothetical protein
MQRIFHGFMEMFHKIGIGGNQFIFVHGSTPEK